MRTETGLMVVHLFCSPMEDGIDVADALAAIDEVTGDEGRVVVAALLGHKADLAVMALHPDLSVLRELQTSLVRAGLEVIDSYVSLTEVSEYAKSLPAEMLQDRLYPKLPIPGKPVFCFYPMSKRRAEQSNWYTTPFEERTAMMYEHGKSGRAYAGKLTQLITASTGLDDYEWGVTLFAVSPEVVKDAVYTMRFDEASARFGDFGTFYLGFVGDPKDVLDAVTP